MQTIVVKEPFMAAKKVQVEKIELHTMQEIVGGHIELVQIKHPLGFGGEDGFFDVWLNEEGKLNGLTPNIALADPAGRVYDVVCGTVFICGTDGEGGSIGLETVDADMAEMLLNHLALTKEQSEHAAGVIARMF